MKGYAPTPAYERVMRRTARTDTGCLIFTGPINHARNGYGMVGIGSKADGTKSVTTAHRVVWEHHNGPIPTGLFVCHRCDNPPCVEIGHLFLGTPLDNTRDMIAKGRDAAAGRTQCGAGLHDWTEENWTTGKVKRCKPCQRQRERESYARRADR